MSQKNFHSNIVLLLGLLVISLLPITIAAQSSRAESAASYFNRGNDWIKKGEWERPIDDFSLAIAFNPKLATAYFNRAYAREAKATWMERWRISIRLFRSISIQPLLVIAAEIFNSEKGTIGPPLRILMLRWRSIPINTIPGGIAG